MPVDRGRSGNVDRELIDDPNIPEWKKLLIMKKRAEKCGEATNKTNVGIEALRNVAPPLVGDKAGFKGVYPATCDDPPSSHSERHHEELKTLRSCPVNQNDAGEAKSNTSDLALLSGGCGGSGGHRSRRSYNWQKMGEDKNLANLDRNDGVERIPAHPGQDDYDDRDLQYGPGIVNKLKSRFINMTLKESAKSPTVVDNGLGMRRYSSLENLVEKESRMRFIDYNNKDRSNVSISRTKGRYAIRNTNFKRAKSMETLFTEHERQQCEVGKTGKGQRPSSIAGHLPESVLVNENLIIVENSNNTRDMDVGGKYMKPVRQLSSSNSINEEELPKPDTVKTYKRMFEPSDNKVGHNVRRKPPPVVRASTKAATAVNKTTGPKHRTTSGSKRPGRTVPAVLNGYQYQPAKNSAKEVEDGVMNGEIEQNIVENGEVEDRVKCSSPVDKVVANNQNTGLKIVVVENTKIVPQPQPSPTSPAIVSPKSPETEDQEDVLKPSTLLGNRQTLWQKPPPSSTSVVFDFRGKDVKPNIGLNPTPFGCKPARVLRKKRSGSPPRIGKDGLPAVNGNVNGILLDDSYEDDDSGIGADLPIISGICFEGENIKIGRGSLLNTRNKKLRIQFNDTATSTFEYPSEASLLEDSPSPNSPIQSSQITDSDISTVGGTSVLRPSVLSSLGEFFFIFLHKF
ncbi:uncharacterized protein LOC111613346 [Centruroides sculpturatus]|uniref:uncharacterized protein LOC111613346 n=1 Tax=Centruroides sculpturatus TaxID=218467 RepID=UPI000C6E3840|nr:uncharacterized protein LOC111613346 [Centruroides sculpturatus]